MVFKQTPKGKIEDLLVEIMSFCDNFMSDMESILKDLDENERLDKENDKERTEVFNHLRLATSSLNMKDYVDVSNHLKSAHFRLTEQEKLDHEDNKYRDEARKKLTELRQKASQKKDEIRNVTQEVLATFNPAE